MGVAMAGPAAASGKAVNVMRGIRARKTGPCRQERGLALWAVVLMGADSCCLWDLGGVEGRVKSYLTTRQILTALIQPHSRKTS